MTNMALRRQAWGILKHVSILDFISAKLSEFDNFLLISSRYGKLCWPQYLNPKDSQSSGLSSSSFFVELNVLLVVMFAFCLVWVSLSISSSPISSSIKFSSPTLASIFLLFLNSFLTSSSSFFLLLFNALVSLWSIVSSGDSNKNSCIMGNETLYKLWKVDALTPLAWNLFIIQHKQLKTFGTCITIPLPFPPIRLYIACVPIAKYSPANIPTAKICGEHTIIPISFIFLKAFKRSFLPSL